MARRHYPSLTDSLPRPGRDQRPYLPPRWPGTALRTSGPTTREIRQKVASARPTPQAMSAVDWHVALRQGSLQHSPKTASDNEATSSLLELTDDTLLEICSHFESARTSAFMRSTCRRFRLLFPRPHVGSLDVSVYPVWESTPAVSRPCAQKEYLPQRATLRGPGGAVKIEIEAEFDAVEMNTLPAISLQLCRPTQTPTVLAAVSPLPLEGLDPCGTCRTRLPRRQRARAVLGSDSEFIEKARGGDFYRLVLDDIDNAPPVRLQPWRFVSATRVLSCRMILTSTPPVPPPRRVPAPITAV